MSDRDWLSFHKVFGKKKKKQEKVQTEEKKWRNDTSRGIKRK
jgi:hypothetical protein